MNSPIKTIIFNFSALLVVIGAVLYLTQWLYAPYLFALGTAGVAIVYFTLPYQQLDFRRRRLHRFNIFAAILMIVASALMFKHRTEWVLCLTIAALLQLYTAFVTPKDK
ncbi:hypothetical protein [Parabacteroides pacaensis]|uniref:hypothetical protein n=1 Tax=Parabacteroides pacaensis TaxID=2086575 RepID=UPI000D0FDC54|nr:hypothetical protein [Parabacteroides pacaensis]